MPFIPPQPKTTILKTEKKEVKKEKEVKIKEETPIKPLKDIKENIRKVTQDVVRRYGNKRSSYVLENDIPVLLERYHWKIIINERGQKEVVSDGTK